MTHRFFSLSVVLAAVATTGCPPSTQGFCIEAAKATCQLQFQCCTAVERQTIFGGANIAVGPYSDEGGCVEVFTRRCEAASQAQDEAIADGRLSFDSDRANACAQQLRDAAAECDAEAFLGNNNDDDCDDLVSGEVSDGDACFSDAECKEPGSECDVEQDVDDNGVFTVTLEGTCKGQGDAGEPCLPDGSCNDELRCLQDPLTGAQLCAPPSDAGGLCDEDDDCLGGLRCAFDASFNRVCTAPAQQGGACDEDADCLAGLSCLNDANFNRVCQQAGALGVPCSSDDDCLVGLLCATDPATFRDVCATTSGSGEPCPDGVAQCEPGLDCRFDGVTGAQRCFAGQNGDPCGNNERCLPGLLCRVDPQQGRDTCQPRLGAGDACDRFTPGLCDAALRCLRDDVTFDDVCSPPLPAAAPCTPNSDEDPCVATHHCAFDGTAGENLCVTRVGAGVDCDDDVECAPGLFCDENNTGVCVGLRNENQSCTDDADCGQGLDCRLNDAGNANLCRALSDANEGCSVLADCVAGLDCRFDDAGVRRVCRGPSIDGGRCEGPGDCAPSLDCRSDDAGAASICRGLSGEDERCEGALDCAAGLECRFDNAAGSEQCEGPGVDGEACGDVSDCLDGLVCRFDAAAGQNLCRALLVVGDACLADGDCTPGLRCRDLDPADEDVTAVCTDRQDNGAACDDDGQCLSGFCEGDGGFCGAPPPELDFEVCDGL